MYIQDWKELIIKRERLSLYLFLLLNALSALFSLVIPWFYTTNPCYLMVVMMATSGLIATMLRLHQGQNTPVNAISLLFGLLWAAQIWCKYHAVHNTGSAYLAISLLNVLIIGVLTFINRLNPFLLFTVPTVVMSLWLDHSHGWLQVLYTVVLLALGIALQQVILRYSDRFAEQLVTRLSADRERLHDLTLIDPLTGLYNRRGLDLRLQELLSQPGHHALLVLDIDHFKQFNDSYGHLAGDEALRHISRTLRDTVRGQDIVARFGGEEFIIVLPLQAPDSAWHLAEALRLQVAGQTFHYPGLHSLVGPLTVSIGISGLSNDAIDAALARADTALYEAKRRGRNCVISSEFLPPA